MISCELSFVSFASTKGNSGGSTAMETLITTIFLLIMPLATQARTTRFGNTKGCTSNDAGGDNV